MSLPRRPPTHHATPSARPLARVSHATLAHPHAHSHTAAYYNHIHTTRPPLCDAASVRQAAEERGKASKNGGAGQAGRSGGSVVTAIAPSGDWISTAPGRWLPVVLQGFGASLVPVPAEGGRALGRRRSRCGGSRRGGSRGWIWEGRCVWESQTRARTSTSTARSGPTWGRRGRRHHTSPPDNIGVLRKPVAACALG